MTTMTIARAAQVAKGSASFAGYALECFWRTLLDKPVPKFPRTFRSDIPLDNRTTEADARWVELPPGELPERLVNIVVKALAAEQVDGMIEQEREFVPVLYVDLPDERTWLLDLDRHFQLTELRAQPGKIKVESAKKSDLRLIRLHVETALERMRVTPAKGRRT